MDHGGLTMGTTTTAAAAAAATGASHSMGGMGSGNKHLKSLPAAARSSKAGSDDGSPTPNCAPFVDKGYRPTIFEQAIRALLHMVQFAVAYFVMLWVLLVQALLVDPRC